MTSRLLRILILRKQRRRSSGGSFIGEDKEPPRRPQEELPPVCKSDRGSGRGASRVRPEWADFTERSRAKAWRGFSEASCTQVHPSRTSRRNLRLTRPRTQGTSETEQAPPYRKTHVRPRSEYWRRSRWTDRGGTARARPPRVVDGLFIDTGTRLVRRWNPRLDRQQAAAPRPEAPRTSWQGSDGMMADSHSWLSASTRAQK